MSHRARRDLNWLLYAFAVVLLYIVLSLLLVRVAYAAKLRVTWVAPTQNSDGTPLTDLAGYRIEWGSCNADGTFGVYQAGINAGAAATSSWVYPTGLNPVCLRLFSINSANVLSIPAYASGVAPPTLGKPSNF